MFLITTKIKIISNWQHHPHPYNRRFLSLIDNSSTIPSSASFGTIIQLIPLCRDLLINFLGTTLVKQLLHTTIIIAALRLMLLRKC